MITVMIVITRMSIVVVVLLSTRPRPVRVITSVTIVIRRMPVTLALTLSVTIITTLSTRITLIIISITFILR